MSNFLLTLLVAAVAGYIGFRVKIPGGFMVGAVLGTSVLSISTGTAYMPLAAKVAAQITAGAFIGSTIKRSDLAGLKKIIKPIFILLCMMLFLNLTVGFIIYKISPLDAITAFMCAVPGGMSDIPIIAADMGADAAKVTVLQFCRMVVGIAVFPGAIAWISRNETQLQAEPDTVAGTTADATDGTGSARKTKIFYFAQTLFIVTVAGLIGKFSGVPAGAMMFSVIAVCAYKIATERVYLPMWIKRMAQVLSGAYIGSSIVLADILELRTIVVPAFILIIGYSINCFLTGKILSKHYDFTQREAMLAATPAGASDMALISSDIGVHSPNLIVIQTIRLLVTVTIFPQIISLVVKLITRGSA